MKFSIIIPVYNRPDEVRELLESLLPQSFQDFEVIIVEDGSTVPCIDVVKPFASRMKITYYPKTNSGPGLTRNYGAERAQGEYLIILDSDVLLPAGYLSAINDELQAAPCDAFGGPDKAHSNFTPMQKAISYAMTSFFTTGGIRGGKKKMDKFFPRSFNMGIRADVFRNVGGFSDMRFGEDVDLSIRIFEKGYKSRLFPHAWVYHKRRTDLRKFFRQVHNSGIARINLNKRHPGTLKLVHMLPAFFTLGCLLLVVGEFFCWWSLLPLALFSMLIYADASIAEHSRKVGVMAVAAAFVQLIGYGSGFLRAWVRRCILRKGEFEAFKKNFYK